MKLRVYRFMESIFSIPAACFGDMAAYFGDMADSVDIELHKKLRGAMKDIIEYRELNVSQPVIQADAKKMRSMNEAEKKGVNAFVKSKMKPMRPA